MEVGKSRLAELLARCPVIWHSESQSGPPYAHSILQKGQPLDFDEVAASNYIQALKDGHGTVEISVSVGSGEGEGTAWGCDLSYDYVKINAEYST
eukprot:scaffold8173_cov672-Prasinococcus_capsulatus_cf.AAC.2